MLKKNIIQLYQFLILLYFRITYSNVLRSFTYRTQFLLFPPKYPFSNDIYFIAAKYSSVTVLEKIIFDNFTVKLSNIIGNYTSISVIYFPSML